MSKMQAPPEKISSNWIASLDGRTELAQIMRNNYRALTDHLGGDASLSYQQRALVEQALWLQYWLRQENAKLAAGGELDIGRVTAASNSLQCLLSKLGLQKKVKELTLDDVVEGAAE